MEEDVSDARVRQLRLVVEAEDFEAAVEFYRDALGMPEEFAVESDGGALVVALQAGRATLEIVNPAQRRLIDDLEVGHDVSREIRVAFEVVDVVDETNRLVDAGAHLIAPPTEPCMVLGTSCHPPLKGGPATLSHPRQIRRSATVPRCPVRERHGTTHRDRTCRSRAEDFDSASFSSILHHRHHRTRERLLVQLRKTAPMVTALGGTEVHDMWSGSVGDTFRVFVGHCGVDPQGILFVTDGNGLFGLAVDTVRLMQIPGLVPSLLVVGVGYPGVDAVIDTAQIRTRDLTPTPSRHFEGSGHAAGFIEFVAGELRPWLTDRYPTAVDHVTFFGHSLGGLFGVYSLLTATSTFDRYIVSSPSLWWDDETIFDIERARADDGRLHSEVYFGIGLLETDAGRRSEAANLPHGHPAKPPSAHLDMVDDMRRFIAQLGSRQDRTLRIDGIEVADEFHATVPGIVLSRALRSFHSTPEVD